MAHLKPKSPNSQNFCSSFSATGRSSYLDKNLIKVVSLYVLMPDLVQYTEYITIWTLFFDVYLLGGNLPL